MLGARYGATAGEICSASASFVTRSLRGTAAGAEGPGAEAWLIWQTWQVISSEAVLWR